MKHTNIWPVVTAGIFLAALPAAWAAPMRGRVTAVDTTAKTITIMPWQSQTATVLHVSDTTQYRVGVPGTAADLKAGQTVRVGGQTTGSTIAARFIQILPAAEASAPAPAGRFFTQGVIAAVTPSMTITTSGGQTETVQMDAAPRIMKTRKGTLADVASGMFVTATTTGPADDLVASLIDAQPAGRFRGRRPVGGNTAPANTAPRG